MAQMDREKTGPESRLVPFVETGGKLLGNRMSPKGNSTSLAGAKRPSFSDAIRTYVV